MSETRSYPRHVKTDAGDIEFRLMSRSDEAAVLAFAQKLPTHDLLFLPRNISQPKVLSAWINEIERGAIVEPAGDEGRDGGRLRHAGARPAFLVAPCRRDPDGGVAGRARAGRRPGAVAGDLCLALGAGLEKLSVQMTVDQQAAIALFESLGFKAEALLRDHVRDVDGKKHDIVVLGHNVAQVRAQMEAYGLPGAVQH